MRNIVLLLALAASAEATNPIQKVIQMLTEMQAKIVKQGEAAQKAYDEYSEWCEDRSKNIHFEIKTGKAQVEELKATIEIASASIEELSAKIEETAASISANEADLKAAIGIREKEAAAFAAGEKELLEVVDALERAIGIVEREMRKGGATMLQIQRANNVAQAITVMVDASMLATQDAKRLTALVQRSSEQADAEDDGAPDPAAYKSHSGGLVETLEGLLDKAKEELESARRSEMNAKNSFEMLQQSLQDELKFGNKDLAAAKKDIATSKGTKATAEGDLAMTAKDLAEDEEVVKTLHQDCMEASEDFEAEVKSRGEELSALAEAKKVISQAAGGAEGVVYGGLQVPSLLQEEQSRLSTGTDLANYEAVRFVRKLAREYKDPALAQLASRMAAAVRFESASSADPFAKVRELIKNMIETLLKDAESEASHKAYCDKEMGDTLEKKVEKEAKIAKLTAEIDSKSGRSAKLQEEIAQLQKELAELARAQAEMDKLRQEEHDLFVSNKADLDQGLEGIKLALKILKEYYAKDDIAHEAAEGSGSSVIGLLEVVESDISKSLAEISADEATSQKSYDRETRENEITRATKERGVKYKTKESAQLNSAIAEASSDLEGVQAELAAILEYKGKLIQMCVAKPESYEERAARREAEIAGLKEALQILEGESVLMQRGLTSRRVFRGAARA